MAKKKPAQVAALVLAAAVAGTSMPPAAGPAVAYAETIDAPSQAFTVTMPDRSEPTGLTAEVYTDSSHTTKLNGTVSVAGNTVTFTPDGTVDSLDTYTYGIYADGCGWTYGGPFTFGGGSIAVTLSQTWSARFTDQNGRQISASEISIADESGNSLAVPATEDGVLDLSGYAEGTKLAYTISEDGYVPAKGTLTVSEQSQTIAVTVKQKTELSFADVSVTKTYGDAPFSLREAAGIPSDYTGTVSVTELSGTDTATEHDGTVTIHGAGSAVFQIRTSDTDLYRGSVQNVSLTVAKKDLGTLDSADITWTGTEKTYDGNTDFAVTGTVSTSLLESGDSLVLTGTCAADAKDAGTHASTLGAVTVSGTGSENYAFTAPAKGPAVTIDRLDLPVKLAGLSVVYGSDDWKTACAGKVPESAGSLLSVDTSGLTDAEKEEAESLDLSDYAEALVTAGTWHTGTTGGAVQLQIKDANAGNFHLTGGGSTADLTVTNATAGESDAWNLLTPDMEKSDAAYLRGSTVFVRPGGRLVYKLTDTSLYDSVLFTSGGTERADIPVASDAKSGDISAPYRIVDSESSGTELQPSGGHAFSIPSGAARVDADAPSVTFAELGTYGKKDEKETSVNTLTFPKILRESGFTLHIDAGDGDGSGMKALQYAIVKIKTADEAETALKNASLSDSTDWTDVPDDGDIAVPGAKSGYRLVLVRAEDNVGNSAVYGSNGYVYDTTSPAVSISGIDADSPYDGDVPYTVTVRDPKADDGSHTGIAQVHVETLADGQVVDTRDITEPSDGTIGSFDASSGVTFAGTIDAKTCNSNNVELRVTVTDRAGNAVTASRHLMIDTTAPTVSASYDTDDAKNGSYFAHDRLLTVDVTERNFDEGKLAFRISVNGKSGTYTAEQIRRGDVPGVYLAADRKDTQGSYEVGSLTDARTNTYVLGFGGNGEKVENSYEVGILYDGQEADLSGTAASSFTVDEVAPVIRAAFVNSSGYAITPGTKAVSPYYDRTAVTGTLTVTDGNFAPEKAGVTVRQTDADGQDVNVYDAGDATWLADGKKHSWTLPSFTGDANYAVSASCEDLAGNKAVLAPAYLTIDSRAPEGTIKARKSNGEETDLTHALTDTEAATGLKGLLFKLFDLDKVTLLPSITDATAGLAKLSYAVIDERDADGETFDSPSAMAGLDWKNLPDDGVALDTDTAALVYVRAEDKAGNVKYLSTDGGIIVDHVDPDAPKLTLDAADGKYSGPAEIAVSASDPANGGAYAGMKDIRYTVTDDRTGVVYATGLAAEGSVRKKTISGAIHVPVIESNAVRITVTATDWAGRTSTSEQTIAMDAVSPKVATSFDTSDARNGHYYNHTKTMTTSFTERNFSPDKAQITFTADGTVHTFTMAQLESGAALSYGVRVSSHTDSGAGTESRDLTDSRTNTYAIEFGCLDDSDTDYSGIAFSCTDTFGNASGTVRADTSAFTVDKVAPVLRVSYAQSGTDITDRIGTRRDTDYATNQTVRARISVTDRNFTAGGVSARVSATDAAGRSTGNYNGSYLSALQAGTWEKDGNTYTGSLPAFAGDAVYALTAQCVDLAGNQAVVYPEHCVTVDKTAPSGSITVTSSDGTGRYTGFSGSSRFTFISKNPIAVTRDASDPVSGVASVYYYKYVPAMDASGDFPALTLADLRNVSWQPWSGDLAVSPDSQCVVYARITDRAGNVSYVSTKGAMIADHTDPALPEISMDVKASEGVYGGSVPVTVAASDPVSGGTYAGLKSVTVEVVNGSTVTQRETQNFPDKAGRTKNTIMHVTVDAAKNNANNVVVRTIVTDWAGNVSSRETTVNIDTTAPRIEVSYDKNTPANGSYFNTARTATVTVYERNFDPKKVNFHITGTDGKEPQISAWHTGSGDGVSDMCPHTCTITYSADADYTFTMDVTDKAGNKTSLGRTDRFTIDRTAPVISVSYDQPDGTYFGRTRTATITVKEHNFDAKLFTANVKAALSGKGITAPSIGAWRTSGDTHTARLVFSADGDYSFTLGMTDLAGNKAAEYASQPFTIDTTKGTIRITGVEDGKAYRGSVSPRIEFADTNYDKKSVKLTLKGVRHEEKEVTGTYTAAKNGGVVTLPDFPDTEDQDDIYTLTASFRDLAGNEQTRSITFSINRFGSNFSYAPDTEKYLKKRYHKKGENLTIYETNVDSLENQTVTLLHDGTAETLDGKDCTIADKSGPNDWKKYAYTLKGGLFDKEGLYEVLITSTDAAGNRQDNKLKDHPITLVIDQTAPSVVITSVENGTAYNASSRKIAVSASDNTRVKSLTVTVDGETKTYSADDLDKLDGKITLSLKDSGKWQTVSAVAKDMAGNASDEAKCRVLVTTNAFVRFMNSQMPYVLTGAIAAAAGAVIVLVGKKRKKKQEEKEKKAGKGKAKKKQTKKVKRTDQAGKGSGD